MAKIVVLIIFFFDFKKRRKIDYLLYIIKFANLQIFAIIIKLQNEAFYIVKIC